MLPHHKWEIGISAGSYYPDLTQEFWGNDIALSYENDHMGMQFFGYSYHIDELTDEKLIASRLFTLQLLLNGCLRIAWNSMHSCPVEFTCFAACNGGAIHSISTSHIENFPFSANPKIDLEESEYRPAKGKFSSHLLHLCKKDVALRSLILQVGLITLSGAFQKIMTWGTLYKIYDTVKYYSKEYGYPIEKFADPKKIKDFHAACNNSLLLGPYARHGELGFKQPKSAITDLDEAVEVIINFAGGFCRHYINEKYP
ncbi:hypothetical protein [Cellvibrio fibrivorans]|uniref:HEPN domain-containing protein n=1 Tax=Cellvibrio fibrivorans TaxID=126350 RepID=A0ABU1UTU3_9GAMM|nr:hypothetical protein [Cellvibrio fibrivorans]MDR7088607.1 hypothetical protein [Cellvibrio fibrivorans]